MAVFLLSRKRIKRKGEHGTDKADRLSDSWAKKGIPEYYQEGNEHMKKGISAVCCFILSVLLGHLQHTIHHRSQLSLPLEVTISTAFCLSSLR